VKLLVTEDQQNGTKKTELQQGVDHRPLIAFLPSNHRNIGKFKPLLRTLEQQGYQVLIICISHLKFKDQKLQEAIASSEFSNVSISIDNFPPEKHWVFQALKRKSLSRETNKIIDHHAPAMLITCFDGGAIQYVIGKEFQNNGIPVTLLPDGVILPYATSYSSAISSRFKHSLAKTVQLLLGVGGPIGSLDVDLILLLNKSGKELFKSKGIDESKVKVIGAPEYDDLYDLSYKSDSNPEAVNQLKAKLNIPADNQVIMIAHQFSLGLTVDYEEELFNAILNTTSTLNTTLVIKFHPRMTDSKDHWENWKRINNYSDEQLILIWSEASSTEVLQFSAICLTVYSTVGLEALVLGVSLVTMDFIRSNHRLPFDKYSGSINAKSIEELQTQVKILLTDETYRKDLQSRSNVAITRELPNTGNSLEQAAAEINLLYNNFNYQAE